MWMNEYEIDDAVRKFQSHPVLGKYAKFLAAFRDEVNAHSDGWIYWQLPTRAANGLMTVLHDQLNAGRGAYPKLPEPTEEALKKTLIPIKTFYTKYGNKAGMQFPELESKPVAAEPKSPTTIEIPEAVFNRIRFFIDGLAVMEVFDREPHTRPLAVEAIALSRLLAELHTKTDL